MRTRKQYMPAVHLGTKRMGDIAELAFMHRAAMEGIGVARPYGDSHAYDVLVQHGRHLSRVQVKSSFTYEKRAARVSGSSPHPIVAEQMLAIPSMILISLPPTLPATTPDI